MQRPIDAILHKAACALCAALVLAAGACAAKHATLPPSAASDSCASWTPSTGHSNAESLGLGCANALNLKNMVADPNDLKVGKVLGPGDGAREALAVEAYKQGKVKELKPYGASTSTMSVGGNK